MRDDTQQLLDNLLAEWHRWAKGFQIVSAHKSSAMFQGVRSSRQWDTENEVIDGTLHDQTMRAFDFNVNELEPVYRTALQFQARNLATGKSVWSSPRLPDDLESRAQLLGLARVALLNRLTVAGIV